MGKKNHDVGSIRGDMNAKRTHRDKIETGINDSFGDDVDSQGDKTENPLYAAIAEAAAADALRND